jgi:hypothetical protein
MELSPPCISMYANLNSIRLKEIKINVKNSKKGRGRIRKQEGVNLIKIHFMHVWR